MSNEFKWIKLFFPCLSVELSLGTHQWMPKGGCVNNWLFGPSHSYEKANIQNPAIYPHHSSRNFWWDFAAQVEYLDTWHIPYRPKQSRQSRQIPYAQVLTSTSKASSSSNSVGEASTSSTSSTSSSVKSWRSLIFAVSSWASVQLAEPRGPERFCNWLENWGSAKPPTNPRRSSYKLSCGFTFPRARNQNVFPTKGFLLCSRTAMEYQDWDLATSTWNPSTLPRDSFQAWSCMDNLLKLPGSRGRRILLAAAFAGSHAQRARQWWFQTVDFVASCGRFWRCFSVNLGACG